MAFLKFTPNRSLTRYFYTDSLRLQKFKKKPNSDSDFIEVEYTLVPLLNDGVSGVIADRLTRSGGSTGLDLFLGQKQFVSHLSRI